MADAFSEIAKSLETLEKDVQNFLASPDVKKTLQEFMAKSANTRVYPLYFPEEYVRRLESGGLGDEQNYEVSVNGNLITVSNETSGNANYSNSEGWDPGYINDIIEKGVGYHWSESKIYGYQPYPRPFMEKGVDDFVDIYLLDEIRKRFFEK